MKNYRKQIVVWLFQHTQQLYTKWFKNHIGWQTDRTKLLNYPTGTLGKKLGQFLLLNDFQLIPKVERHDVYHVLTGFGTKVEDEIALQYLCFGNGKRSLYLYGAMILGTILLPDYFRFYLHSYQKGLKANSFHHYDYEKLLHIQLDELKAFFFGSKENVPIALYP